MRLPGAPSGFGLLLTTESGEVELGTFHGRRLRGRVERRLLRLALGQRGGAQLTLSRARPVAVLVTEGDRSYELPVGAPPDPWVSAVRRVLLLWVLSLVLVAALGRRQGTPEVIHAGA